MRTIVPSVLLVLLAAGCAGERSVRERGWLGGRWADVGAASALSSAEVRGLPQGVSQDGAALAVGAWPATPAARAGLAPGDLVLAVDGTPVESAADLADAFAERAPGSSATVTCRRDGVVRDATVVVGRERWERRGTLRVGLSLSSRLDLWPFDDGIDVLGLVRARTVERAPDLAGPEAAYLRGIGEEPDARGDAFDVSLLILGGGVSEHVLSQEEAAEPAAQ